MASISSIQTLTLDLPPSCIAFCPSQPHLFVVGTYFLHPQAERSPISGAVDGVVDADEENDGDKPPVEAKRTGSLILFRLDGETITQIETQETDAAILDLQWSPHTPTLLAVATSHGLVEFYTLRPEDGTAAPSLAKVDNWILVAEDALALSLAWHPTRPACLGVTTSSGAVYLCESEASSNGEIWGKDSITDVQGVHRHDLEAWTMAWLGDEVGLLSGGDDAVLRYFNHDTAGQAVKWFDRRFHGAGVTAILPLTPELALTGSYDDHIRLISCPAVGRREVKAELRLGGGVWRLKVLEREGGSADVGDRIQRAGSYSLIILASCMHAGTRIVRLRRRGGEDGAWEFDVMGKFEEHESMNYGSDVQPGSSSSSSSRGGERVIVSTSFYDKRMCLWRYDTSRGFE